MSTPSWQTRERQFSIKGAEFRHELGSRSEFWRRDTIAERRNNLIIFNKIGKNSNVKKFKRQNLGSNLLQLQQQQQKKQQQQKPIGEFFENQIRFFNYKNILIYQEKVKL
jgi:hypothetical protein